MFRIGHGYDVHQFVENRPLMLCGIEIPFEQGLKGHSDADVALHALMDAILGGLALGDIGSHFADTDSRFKDIDSKLLVNQVVELMESSNYCIGNVDLTIIAQMPKLKPYILTMRESVAGLLHTDIGNVNIKATTEEKLGFTGRMEGMSSHAVCILTSKE